jgi:nucleotide-binding universal stress UspA family protein
MPEILDRRGDSTALTAAGAARARPVILGTLAVRVHPTAERVALESALEAGVALVVANMIMLPAYPTTMILAPQYTTLPHEEDLDALRETASRAAGLGIRTELLRISSTRPVRALLELASERDAGLLVFGPDVRLTNRIRFWAAARAVRRGANCLVWIAPDG